MMLHLGTGSLLPGRAVNNRLITPRVTQLNLCGGPCHPPPGPCSPPSPLHGQLWWYPLTICQPLAPSPPPSLKIPWPERPFHAFQYREFPMQSPSVLPHHLVANAFIQQGCQAIRLWERGPIVSPHPAEPSPGLSRGPASQGPHTSWHLQKVLGTNHFTFVLTGLTNMAREHTLQLYHNIQTTINLPMLRFIQLSPTSVDQELVSGHTVRKLPRMGINSGAVLYLIPWPLHHHHHYHTTTTPPPTYSSNQIPEFIPEFYAAKLNRLSSHVSQSIIVIVSTNYLTSKWLKKLYNDGSSKLDLCYFHWKWEPHGVPWRRRIIQCMQPAGIIWLVKVNLWRALWIACKCLYIHGSKLFF